MWKLKITYFNKIKREKQVREEILGQKLTLNNPSLVDNEETRILVMAHKREREKKKEVGLIASTWFFDIHWLFWFV